MPCSNALQNEAALTLLQSAHVNPALGSDDVASTQRQRGVVAKGQFTPSAGLGVDEAHDVRSLLTTLSSVNNVYVLMKPLYFGLIY